MKRHRKLVALLVALTFLFSIVAPAMAATPSAQEKAADKLNVLGIIEGYPDGSFGLDRTITRAEFAKVAVMAAGLGELEPLLKNTPSKFSDVPMEWFTGWINIAANQGFVKGDPDGKFRPNDNINYAEVITVLLRLLGYNENLPGDWPANFLAKAVDLGITKGLSFDVKAPAVRGDVFVLVDKVLDTPMVEWDNEKQAFVEKKDGDNKVKLISKSFDGVMKSGLLVDIEWDREGDIVVTIAGTGKDDMNDLSRYEVLDNAIVTGAADIVGLLGSNIEYIVNDDDELVYAGAKETKTTSKNKITVNEKTVVVDKKTYTKAEGFDWTSFPGDVDLNANNELVGDNVVVVLNSKGEAQWAFVYEYDGLSLTVVDNVSGNYINTLAGKDINIKDKDIAVIKNGALASVDALAEGDLMFYVENVRGLDYLIVASDEVISGTLKDATVGWKKITVDGTTYDVHSGALVSDDEGESFDAELAKDMIDEAVQIMLSPVGKVAVVISGAGAAPAQYGILLDARTVGWNNEVRMLTADGSKVTYQVTDAVWGNIWESDEEAQGDTGGEGTQDDSGGEDAQEGDNAKKLVYAEKLVKYTFDKKGRINSITVGDVREGSFVAGDKDTSRLQIADGTAIEGEGKNKVIHDNYTKKWYKVTGDTVFFVKNGDKINDWTTTKWSTFVKSNAFTKYAEYEAYVVDGNVVKFVAYKGPVATSANYGVVMKIGYKKDAEYVDVAVKENKVERYEVGTVPDDLSSGDYISFTVQDDEIDIEIVETKASYKEKGKLVDKVGNDYIRVKDTDDDYEYYDVDSKTTYVDVTGSTPKLADGVAKGNYIVVKTGDKDIAAFVLIVPEPQQQPTPGDGGTTTTVTYIVEAYKAAFGRFDVEDKYGKKSSLFVEDFDGFKLNGIEVSETVMLYFLEEADEEALTGVIIKVETTKAGDKILNLEGVDEEAVEKAKALDEIKPEFAASKEAVVVKEEDIPPIKIDGEEVNFENETVYMAQVTLKVDTKNDRKVRLSVEYDDDIVTVYVQDSKGNWFVNPTVWGPAEGFSVNGGYEATTTVYFTVEGEVDEVEFTITLVDVEWSKDEAKFVYGTKHFTIELPEVEADEE